MPDRNSGGSGRAALIAVLDALEDGDVALAEAILLNVLESDGPAARPYRCEACRVGFEWPGLRDAHHCVAAGRGPFEFPDDLRRVV